LTLTFELGRDLCSTHLNANYRHPKFSLSGVIVLTNTLTTNRRR